MATTIPDSHRDLLDASVATLATLDGDGRPQQTVIWFLAESDTIRISLNTDRQKVKNLRSNPRADLLVLDLANPQRYLELRGDVEITDDTDYAFATKVGAKYAADLRAYDAPGSSRVIVTIKPTRVRAVDMSAG
jgi:PPOX class probable F420-dependent enzyme